MGIDLTWVFRFIAGFVIGFIAIVCIRGYAQDRYNDGVRDALSGKYKVDTTVTYLPIK